MEHKPRDELLEAVENLPDTIAKIAIVAALDRELHPLVKAWPTRVVEHDSRNFRFYESTYAVVTSGGIGPEAARRAAEAAIVKYSPEVIISAGVAGALVPELHVGETIFPAFVIDAQDGSRHQTALGNAPVANTPQGRAILVSSRQIASTAQKQQLAKSYLAQAVDMEAAAVARAAMSHHLPFVAIKAISDEYDCQLPEMSQFIRDGQFQQLRFAIHVGVRPWLWLRTFRLARDTRIASENLCAWLRESVLTNTIVVSSTPKP